MCHILLLTHTVYTKPLAIKRIRSLRKNLKLTRKHVIYVGTKLFNYLPLATKPKIFKLYKCDEYTFENYTPDFGFMTRAFSMIWFGVSVTGYNFLSVYLHCNLYIIVGQSVFHTTIWCKRHALQLFKCPFTLQSAYDLIDRISKFFKKLDWFWAQNNYVTTDSIKSYMCHLAFFTVTQTRFQKIKKIFVQFEIN